MAAQKRKRGDILSSPESRKAEPTSKKQAIGKGVKQGEPIVPTNVRTKYCSIPYIHTALISND